MSQSFGIIKTAESAISISHPTGEVGSAYGVVVHCNWICYYQLLNLSSLPHYPDASFLRAGLFQSRELVTSGSPNLRRPKDCQPTFLKSLTTKMQPFPQLFHLDNDQDNLRHFFCFLPCVLLSLCTRAVCLFTS